MHDNLTAAQTAEWINCRNDPEYFIRNYVIIECPEKGSLIPFTLWDSQVAALSALVNERQLVVLKARQLGLTWLVLSYALWQMVCHEPASVLLFSLREAEAAELLRRMRGIYSRLPRFLQDATQPDANAAAWRMECGSSALAFSTRAGRSYTGTLAIVDEADYVPRLADFLNAVKPTIDGGGQLVLISTADKARPRSTFKRLFRAGWAGTGSYRAIFLPWNARPERSAEWYARVRVEMRQQRGSDDDFLQEYPATPEEAMQVRALSARLPGEWVRAASAEAEGLGERSLPAWANQVAGLVIFAPPRAGESYVAGADPAEGNPNSDESVVTVVHAESGEQVALAAGRMTPERFAAACATLCAYYNEASLLVERNNHGHTVLAWLHEQGANLLRGTDGKPGWLTTALSKTRLYDEAARQLAAGEITLHDAATASQLALIDAGTLRAPEGDHDDRATAMALAMAARAWGIGGAVAAPVAARDVVEHYDRGDFV
jgi:hypothetical protein